MTITAGKTLSGKIIADRFMLKEHLADDPSGSLYFATDLNERQRVLVLAIAEAAQIDEDPATRTLRHPNIIAYRSSHFPNNKERFVIVDAPAGMSLAQIIAGRGPLTPKLVTFAALQILPALQAIHDAGTFHGNLNPENVFINRTKKGKLGVRFIFPGAVRIATPFVPAFCFAPEQVCGESVDHRVDIWAVGALLFSCLFGRLPFEGQNWEEISGKILLKDHAFPSKSEKLPAELLKLIDKALQKKREKRQQSAQSMKAELFPIAKRMSMQPMSPAPTVVGRQVSPQKPITKNGGVQPSESHKSATKPRIARPIEQSQAETKIGVIKVSGEASILDDEDGLTKTPILSDEVKKQLGLDFVESASPPTDIDTRGEVDPLPSDEEKWEKTTSGLTAVIGKIRGRHLLLEISDKIKNTRANLATIGRKISRGREWRRSIAGEKKRLVIAAACLAAALAVVAVVVIFAQGNDAFQTESAEASATPPYYTAVQESIPVEPPKSVHQEEPTLAPAREKRDEETSAASDEEASALNHSRSAPNTEVGHGASQSGERTDRSPTTPPRHKSKRRLKKKEPANQKKSLGLASNPFGG